jgi:2-polyprenyl-3-methyl-5-hydroxy-6-metoxy-1,4-benzoquinol methylase
MSVNYKNYYKDHYKVNFSENDIDMWNNWFQVQWKLIQKKVKLEKKIKVLDIGAGFGGFYKALVDDGFKPDYLGIDLDPKIVEFTNKHFRKKILKFQHFEKLKPVEKYDLIVAFEVLEHVENPSQVVSKIYEHLKPGGVFCGTTPYPFKKNIVSDKTHISVLHPGNWQRIFELAKFKKATVEPMSFAPLLWRINPKLNIRIPYFVRTKGFVSTSLIIAKK